MAKNLTPYQGTKRRFGYFQCSKCDREWCSALSWANKGQECRDCAINVYPHKQKPLKFSNGPKVGDDIAHHVEKCEMCKELGYNCKRYRPPRDRDDEDDGNDVWGGGDSDRDNDGYDYDDRRTRDEYEDYHRDEYNNNDYDHDHDDFADLFGELGVNDRQNDEYDDDYYRDDFWD